MKSKRILAMAGVVIILICYAIALVCAFIGSPNARSMLMAALFCTIVVPVILYAYQMIYRLGTRDKHTAEGSSEDNKAEQKES